MAAKRNKKGGRGSLLLATHAQAQAQERLFDRENASIL